MAQVTIPQIDVRDLGAPAFQDQARSVLILLRAAWSGLIEAVPGSKHTATELQRSLGVGSTLAWHVFEIIRSGDPLAAAVHVPGRAATERLFKAAARRGVPEMTIASAQDAFRGFEDLVRTHAGSRRAFDSMISGLLGAGDDLVSVQERRAAFRANSHIWGAQTKVALRCCLLHPGDRPGNVDVAVVSGKVDLRRLRSDVELVVSTIRREGEEARMITPEPVDLELYGARTGLLREFCSQPLPNFRARLSDDGYLRVELPAGPIGSTAALTYFMADATYGHELYPADRTRKPEFNYLVTCTTPIEAFVYDLLVYDGLFRDVQPEAYVCGHPLNGPAAVKTRPLSPRLPVQSEATWVGRGPAAVQCPGIARYPEMISHVCRKLGWDAEKFDVCRCRVEYPILHSIQVIHFDLSENAG